MGLCASATVEEQHAQALSKKIDAQQAKARRDDEAVHKLLLLGAGESGKSTLFKQMVQIYGSGLSVQDLESYIPIVCNNTIEIIKTLIVNSRTFGNLSEVAQPLATKLVEVVQVEDRITPEIAKAIHAVWLDPVVQEAYANRSKFQISDSAGYFMEKALAVGEPNFIPSVEDVLRCRVRTTGIVEEKFLIEGNFFRIFDVGGQRNERKKWIHCFDSVTAIIFVAALSGYDQTLFEDQNVNRMDEALTLFQETVNNRFFSKTAFILFLNKRDLFAEKIKTTPLTVWRPDYTGGNSYEDAVSFIGMEFQAQNKRGPSRTIYTHITCATDTNNMFIVFNTVQDIVVKFSLQESGLV